MRSFRPILSCLFLLTACPDSSTPSEPAADSDDDCVEGTHLCTCLGGTTCDGELVCEAGFCVEPASGVSGENPPTTTEDPGSEDSEGGSTDPTSDTESSTGDTTGPDEGSTSSDDEGPTDTGPVQGSCEPGAICAVDTTGDGLGDRCIYTCDSPSDCPHAPELQCYTCTSTVVGDVCVPDQNTPDLFECNSLWGATGLEDGALCLPMECGATSECTFPIDPPGVSTAGYCAPACTPTP